MIEFWRLFKQSVIVQALLTLCITITICILLVKGLPVPELLSGAFWVILGFYFGAKSQAALMGGGEK